MAKKNNSYLFVLFPLSVSIYCLKGFWVLQEKYSFENIYLPFSFCLFGDYRLTACACI